MIAEASQTGTMRDRAAAQLQFFRMARPRAPFGPSPTAPAPKAKTFPRPKKGTS